MNTSENANARRALVMRILDLWNAAMLDFEPDRVSPRFLESLKSFCHDMERMR